MSRFPHLIPAHHAETLKQVENYIEINLSKEITVRELADMSFTSYDHFQHRFSKYYKKSPWSFVKQIKLEHAAGFLRHSDYSISLIGDMIGYSTKHSFSKAFSSYFNMSPKSFRALTQLPVDKHTEHAFDKVFRVSTPGVESYLDKGRFEFLPTGYYNFKRINGREAASFDRVLYEFMQNDKFVARGLMITSPDIYCMRYQDWLTREDCGYFTRDNEIDHSFSLQKKFERGRYFVMPIHEGHLSLISLFIYDLINTTTRSGYLKIRSHYSFVKINFIPSYSIEAWIPVL